jgi:hypothetical protein
MKPAYYMTPKRKPAPARTNPVLQVGYAVDDVWAAAVLADRINSGYVKETEYHLDMGTGRQSVVRETNRFVIMDTLQNHPELITDELRAEGQSLRNQLAQDLTLRTLKGKTTGFDNSIQQCLAVTDRFYTVSHRFELAVIPSLPRSMRETVRRADVDSLLRECGPVAAKPGTKVDLAVRVVKSFYSQNFNVNYITAVTEDNQAVVFTHKERFDFNTELKIHGNVREHSADSTRLNRVKVL